MRLIKHRLVVLDDGARTKKKQNKTHFGSLLKNIASQALPVKIPIQ